MDCVTSVPPHPRHAGANPDRGETASAGRLAAARRRLVIALTLWAVALGTLGCSRDDKTSPAPGTHFDHDHEVPHHWPDDLADLRSKLDSRLRDLRDLRDLRGRGAATDASHLEAELADLIAWTPAVAADTDLSETEWTPIYEQTEAIRALVQGDGWSTAARQRARRLCELLRVAEVELAQRNASLPSPPSWQPSSLPPAEDEP